jgi:hypothetical protein
LFISIGIAQAKIILDHFRDSHDRAGEICVKNRHLKNYTEIIKVISINVTFSRILALQKHVVRFINRFVEYFSRKSVS